MQRYAVAVRKDDEWFWFFQCPAMSDEEAIRKAKSHGEDFLRKRAKFKAEKVKKATRG